MLESWQEKIPSLSRNFAILIFIINIFIPGIGTLMMALSKSPICGDCIVVAILQIITIPLCFIGLIWSIWWGWICYSKSKPSESTLLG